MGTWTDFVKLSQIDLKEMIWMVFFDKFHEPQKGDIDFFMWRCTQFVAFLNNKIYLKAVLRAYV